ncbi:pyridoxamine 5'-phosphate oxidase family protein [Agromyces aurantiacus]|uniref:Pyridoxamine 5'-phosphate oxidase family protein n=1 Tax=Agromyces aurantiacus TaxID=165814 RepID=A0ABV9R607_9MICO|nr:pyridoxamine 5'-phosphate oxidase family protein [Agromyces aurantiacus]MBM7503591.1 nitroimidazol reductase NimA-like FMN-containing flavoprotein (pyridoxamine 5'-phosphate oxidase superfamily) [Agromyces aurantiacus]
MLHARQLVASNRYLALATVDAEGRPWCSPVYFAADDELECFYWMSATTSRHSRNIVANPEVSLAVFDSTVEPYHGRGVYSTGLAEVVAGDELQGALTVYPGDPSRGGSPITAEEVSDPSPWRLYRARAAAIWVLCPRPPRQPCPRHGRDDDHRARVR